MVSGGVIRWLAFAWRGLTSVGGWVLEALGVGPDVDPHTRVTFRAIVDAVIPETPGLAEELGPEHAPGGLAIGLDEFAITYIDDGFQFGLPDLGPQGNIELADPKDAGDNSNPFGELMETLKEVPFQTDTHEQSQ